MVGGIILGISCDKVNYMIIDGEEWDMVFIIVENYEKLGFDVLVILGGGGIVKNVYKFVKVGLNVLYLFKMIDNDIVGIDDFFGFLIVLEIVMEVIDWLYFIVYFYYCIIFVEIMGYCVGWLVFGLGIVGGVDVILLFEVFYKLDFIV